MIYQCWTVQYATEIFHERGVAFGRHKVLVRLKGIPINEEHDSGVLGGSLSTPDKALEAWLGGYGFHARGPCLTGRGRWVVEGRRGGDGE